MKKIYLIVACSFACMLTTKAQLVSTLAGQTATGSADGTGSAASFNAPTGVCVDPSGNVYVADRPNQVIRKITPAGVVTTFAGSGTIGSANGTGTLASFWYPQNLCSDLSGNIYVTDSYNNKIRMITPAGVVTTFAGSGSGGVTNGPVASASFNSPIGICIDLSGNIYVSEEGNQTIRKISSGTVSTLAGTGGIGMNNGAGNTATFNYPAGICADASGNIYVTDQNNHAIRKVTPAGVVSTFAGTGTSGSLDGTGTAASFNSPTGVSADASGNIYVADYSNSRIRKIDPSGVVTTFAGSAGGGYADGNVSVAKFYCPISVSCYTGGIVYVCDRFNNRVRVITPCSAPGAPVSTSTSSMTEVCAGTSATLAASSTGSVSWYSASTGGTAIATGTTYTTSTTLAAGAYTYYAEAATACTVSTSRTSMTVSIDVCTGISSHANEKLAGIYPNPGNGLFTVSLADNSAKNISVIDLTGRTLSSDVITENKLILDLTAYPAGLYFIKISSAGKSETLKLVKQ